VSLDVAGFVARYPEFSEVGELAPAMVTSAINSAKNFVSQSLWGARYEEGVLCKAAHLLAMTPMGENARLDKSSPETTYGLVFKEMLRALPVRFMVSGRLRGC